MVSLLLPFDRIDRVKSLSAVNTSKKIPSDTSSYWRDERDKGERTIKELAGDPNASSQRY